MVEHCRKRKWKLLQYILGDIGVIWGYMEKKMETITVLWMGSAGTFFSAGQDRETRQLDSLPR